jgi:hypothetical protein
MSREFRRAIERANGLRTRSTPRASDNPKRDGDSTESHRAF